MRYPIYDGGNELQLPFNTILSGRVGNYRVNYAEHHKRRTVEIEKHIDTQSYTWNGFDGSITGESDDKPIILATGDELATHIFGTGSLFDYVAFHVKREGSGTITPFIEQDDGTRLAVLSIDGTQLSIDLSVPGHYYGVVPAPAKAAAAAASESGSATAKAVAADAATAGVTTVNVTIPGQTVKNVSFNVVDADGKAAGTATGTVTTADQTVTVDVPRGAAADGAGYGLPARFMTTDNGVVGFVFTAEKDDDGKDMAFDACMGIFMAVKDFWDEHECECAPQACDTEYPDAVCTPNKKAKK